MLAWSAIAATLAALPESLAQEKDHFAIRVVDEETGRGVPLVELKTVNGVRHYTDSAGMIAFHEPGLMNQAVYFRVKSHGYEFPADGFGFRGARIRVQPGGEATLKIKRLNIAERLYRVTGAGIYRDSVLLGHDVPTAQPLLNGRVFGSDSVVNSVYREKLYWFWGDTNRPSYPLGNFHVPGATSLLPGDGGLPVDRGVDLEYFLDDSGFAKATAQMPGQGPTWINALTTINEPDGRERLLAAYVKYSFYNPKHHAAMDQDGGRVIFFEGTYTNMFSGNPDQTPRYNYNQIMYRLDLSDPRLRSDQAGK